MVAAQAGERTAWWARFVLLGGIVAALLLALAPIGYRIGIFETGTAVLLLPGMAAALGTVVLGFALVGGVLTIRHGMGRERMPLIIGAALALLVVANMVTWFMRSTVVPPIHNITTDPLDPPEFVAVVELRGEDANPLEYDAEALAAVTREAYPALRPLVTPDAPEAAFQRSRQVAERLGWQIVDADPAAGRIEATVTTRFYGFKDDVVVRVRPDAEGSRIDLRSVSRVGQSDLGANAGRIMAFINAYEEDR